MFNTANQQKQHLGSAYHAVSCTIGHPLFDALKGTLRRSEHLEELVKSKSQPYSKGTRAARNQQTHTNKQRWRIELPEKGEVSKKDEENGEAPLRTNAHLRTQVLSSRSDERPALPNPLVASENRVDMKTAQSGWICLQLGTGLNSGISRRFGESVASPV